VTGVLGGLLDHVDEHSTQRHRLAEPRYTDVVERELVDHLAACSSGPAVERQDVVGGFVFGDAQIGVLVLVIEGQRLSLVAVPVQAGVQALLLGAGERNSSHARTVVTAQPPRTACATPLSVDREHQGKDGRCAVLAQRACRDGDRPA
jgi:hypothetical protein